MILNSIPSINNKRTAVVYLTKSGEALADKVSVYFNDVKIFNSSFSIGQIFQGHYSNFQNIVLIMAVGIAVRKIAPFIYSKSEDPAVVVIDEKGKFVISLLSGHLGGANELARFIASKLSATPVITTATDINKKFAIDLLPRHTGWVIENPHLIKVVNSAILNNEKVAINVPCSFLKRFVSRKFLSIFNFIPDVMSVVNADCKGKVVVSDSLNVSEDLGVLIFRPKNVYIGVGCNRGISLPEVEGTIFDVIKSFDINFKCVKSMSSIDIKRDEPALLQFCSKFMIDFICYTKDELNSVNDKFDKSDYLIKNLGVKGVCEPAAILSARKDMMRCLKRVKVSGKIKIKNMTVAIQKLIFS